MGNGSNEKLATQQMNMRVIEYKECGGKTGTRHTTDELAMSGRGGRKLRGTTWVGREVN